MAFYGQGATQDAQLDLLRAQAEKLRRTDDADQELKRAQAGKLRKESEDLPQNPNMVAPAPREGGLEMRYAKGGPVKGHDDESEDRKLFGKMIKEYESREDKSAKGNGAKAAKFAAGGPVAGTTRNWWKEPDPFRAKESGQGKQDYSDKGGEKGQAKEKSEVKQVKPRG